MNKGFVKAQKQMKQEIVDKDLMLKKITTTFNVRDNMLKAKRKREAGHQTWGEYFFGETKLKDVVVPPDAKSNGEKLYDARKALMEKI